MGGKKTLDGNTEVLYQWYNTLEYLLYGGEPEIEINEDIVNMLTDLSDTKKYLLNKMFIASCHHVESREQFIKLFEAIVEHGEDWAAAINNSMAGDEEMDG